MPVVPWDAHGELIVSFYWCLVTKTPLPAQPDASRLLGVGAAHIADKDQHSLVTIVLPASSAEPFGFRPGAEGGYNLTTNRQGIKEPLMNHFPYYKHSLLKVDKVEFSTASAEDDHDGRVLSQQDLDQRGSGVDGDDIGSCSSHLGGARARRNH